MDKKERTFGCTIPGFAGSVTFKFMGYPEYLEWNRYINKGQKRDLLALRKDGITVEKEEEVILTTAWSSSLMIESWDVYEELEDAEDGVLGEAISAPHVKMYPTEWTYGLENKPVPFALFQWFRFVASGYISKQIAPNVKTQQ